MNIQRLPLYCPVAGCYKKHSCLRPSLLRTEAKSLKKKKFPDIQKTYDRSPNPNVKTRVVWVNEWFNPPKETEAATALINGGADVLIQNTDSSAVLQTAEKMGKRAFGWDSDMTAYGPKAHLVSAVINWGQYYIKTAASPSGKARSRTIPARNWSPGMWSLMTSSWAA